MMKEAGEATQLQPLDRVSFGRVQIGPFTEIPVEMYHGQLGAASAILYTAPAVLAVENPLRVRPSAILEELWICNADTVVRTVTLYKVENGGAVANNRLILPAVAIQPNEAYQVTGRFRFGPSATLRGLASAASAITLCAMGVELYA